MTFPGERVQIDVKMVPTECLVGELHNNEEHYYQYTCIDGPVFNYWEAKNIQGSM